MIEQVRREHALSLNAFNAVLARFGNWADADAMIGGSPKAGNQPWLWVDRDGTRYYLNADTKGDGVAAYLALLARHGPALTWSIVANNRGKMNKVAFGPDRVKISGFYLYRADV
jgi:hypothetical protein